MQIINSLVPIFAVIGLGMLLRKQGFLNAESTRTFNRFAYFYGLPFFLFYKLAGAVSISESGNLILQTLLIAVITTAALAWVATGLLRVSNSSRGTMIQAAFRGNLAFMGLPLVLFLIEVLPGEEAASIEAAMLVAITPAILFFNVASVLALATYNRRTESEFSTGMLITNIAKNPLIWACLAGALFQYFRWPLPVAIERTFGIVGASAFPLALLGIGSQLISITSSHSWGASLLPTAIKCVICPLIGWGVGTAIGLGGVELQVTLIMCAVPTAVSSFVLADQMGGDSDLAASTVVICTAFSLPTLALLIWLTG